MKRFLGLVTLAATVGFALPASAASIYIVGSECPPDPLAASYDRQYYVTSASHCMFSNPTVANIQGTNTEADAYLNAAAAQPAWGTGWVGLGQTGTNGTPSTIAGFSFTTDAANDDGTFIFSGPLTATYGQFALAVKDGGDPKWAIFLLPTGVTTGGWGLSTNGGDLSHFALFARGTPSPVFTNQAVPEPASLLLFGTGLAAVARRFRKNRR